MPQSKLLKAYFQALGKIVFMASDGPIESVFGWRSGEVTYDSQSISPAECERPGSPLGAAYRAFETAAKRTVI